MAETKNISEMANRVSENIFQHFGWKRATTAKDVNWDCESDAHDKETHPSDLVYWYDDPYDVDRVYLNVDLKSYSADSLSKPALTKALQSLNMAVECANVGTEWAKNFSVSSGNYHVDGMLFIYNHDKSYDKKFRDVLTQLPPEAYKLVRRHRTVVFGPEDIAYLGSVANDLRLLRGDKKLPDASACHFYYPHLVRSKAKSALWSAATADSLLGPWQIIHHANPDKPGVAQYIIYYREKGATSEEFAYIFDLIFRYQMLQSEKTHIRIRMPFTAPTALQNFQRGRAHFLEGFPAIPALKATLEQVTCHKIDTIVYDFNENEIGMDIR